MDTDGNNTRRRKKQIYYVVEKVLKPKYSSELTKYDGELRGRLEGEKGQSRLTTVFRSLKEKLRRGKLSFWKLKSKDDGRHRVNENELNRLSNDYEDVNTVKVEMEIDSNNLEILDLPEYLNGDDNTLDEQSEAYKKLHSCKFYWGPVTSQEAEQELRDKPDGTFLIRDSCSARHVYSLSFRSWGRTLHTRIDFDNGYFKIFSKEGYSTINLMLEAAMQMSKNGVYCFTQSNNPLNPSYPVRLLSPLSRFTKISSLKHMCRFIIRQHVNINDISNLQLPETVKSYLIEPYFK